MEPISVRRYYAWSSSDLCSTIEPTDIVTADLTHILYAFADVQPDTGTIVLTDLYADEQVC
jgi:GH18 family chitinase